MAGPLMEGFEELLDGFLLGPEIAMKNGDIRDRAGALLRHELLDRRVPCGGIPDGPAAVRLPWVPALAVQLGHGLTSSF